MITDSYDMKNQTGIPTFIEPSLSLMINELRYGNFLVLY